MKCTCASCGKQFRAVSSFDRHRTGVPEARRCLSRIEMRSYGWQLNADGYWRPPRTLAEYTEGEHA
jgi:hypothetical protein